MELDADDNDAWPVAQVELSDSIKYEILTNKLVEGKYAVFTMHTLAFLDYFMALMTQYPRNQFQR